MEALLRPRRPTEEGFDSHYDMFVGIAFGADWCGPCRRLNKTEIAKATPQIKWYYCDVDENNTSLGYCGLSAIPSFVLIRDGLFVDRASGLPSVDAVVDWVEKNKFPVRKQ